MPHVRSGSSAYLRRRLVGFAAIASLTIAASGCTTAHVADPLTRTLSASTPEAQGEFWYQLARRPITSNDEAFHALLLYVDGKDPTASYAERVRALSARGLLPRGFAGGADDAVDRGTLAVAVDQLLHIRGGLTMQLFGPSPRYALRAAVDRGLFPPSSPNQAVSGGQFVGIMQRAEEFERGSPADGPASQLPEQVHPIADATVGPTPPLAADLPALPADGPVEPMYLDAVAATAPVGPVHLRAIVTAVQGELVEIRPNPGAAWQRARPGTVMKEGAEIRTGPKSAIRFLIPRDEAFCLDSQGAVTLQQAVIDVRQAKTRMGLEHGRLREDLSHAAPVQIEQAGLAHDTVIQSPHSALAIRGTKVSLFEQASFDPVAISLTGQATFTNTDGIRVPVGGTRRAVIVGNQTGAAQQAAVVEGVLTNTGNSPRLQFEERELAIVSQRGGFFRGDVVVGSLYVSDFGYKPNGNFNLPGGLQFVLQWSGGAQQQLNDLNLAVFSPRNTATSPDFVANPPYTVSLTPNSPTSIAIRNSTYPAQSASGGRISANSVGPDGLELAFWPKVYPTGTYQVAVYDLVDAKTPPAGTVNPVTYTVTAYLNGKAYSKTTNTIGEFQTQTASFTIPAVAPTTTARRTRVPRPLAASQAQARADAGRRSSRP